MSHRTSAAAALMLLLAGPARGDEACDTLGYEGRCEDARVVWCEDEQVRKTDCGAIGRACGWDERNGYYACVEGEAAGEGCDGGLTWAGRCEGEQRVEWCQDGTEQALVCTDGTRCGWSPEGYYDCVTGTSAAGGNAGGEPQGGEAPEAEPRDPAVPAPEKDPTVTEAPEGGEPDQPAPDADTGAPPLPKTEDAAIQPAYGCGAAPGSGSLPGVALALGALLVLHRTCRPRPARARR